MATTRAFAYNTGQTIAGTTQVGNIAFLNPGQTIDFAATGLKWYNGPDESETASLPAGTVPGWVIGVTGKGNTTSPDGTTSPIKFFRSSGFTESAFIELAQSITGQIYASGASAAADLALEGYFTSWVSSNEPSYYTAFDHYVYNNILTPNTCPTSAEANQLYLGSDNKIYTSQTSSALFNSEIQQGLVDQAGLFGGFMGVQSGRVYTVTDGVLSLVSGLQACPIF
jgi:hypothetical protein